MLGLTRGEAGKLYPEEVPTKLSPEEYAGRNGLAERWTSVGPHVLGKEAAQSPAWPTGAAGKCGCAGVGRGGRQGDQGTGWPQLSIRATDLI